MRASRASFGSALLPSASNIPRRVMEAVAHRRQHDRPRRSGAIKGDIRRREAATVSKCMLSAKEKTRRVQDLMLHSPDWPACSFCRSEWNWLEVSARMPLLVCFRRSTHTASHIAGRVHTSICCRLSAMDWRWTASASCHTFQNAAGGDAASAATLLATPSTSRWTSSLQFLR